MIEHIGRREGQFMLHECCRVMKPDGTIRIATPDLEVIAGLYAGGTREGDRDYYIRWVTDKLGRKSAGYRPGFVINQAFYNWGHQFLYDRELLAAALTDAGFRDIRRCAMGASEDEHCAASNCTASPSKTTASRPSARCRLLLFRFVTATEPA